METLVQAKTQNTDVENTGYASRYVSAQEAMQAVEILRAETLSTGIAEMSMEEIDEEIAAYRREQREMRERGLR